MAHSTKARHFAVTSHAYISHLLEWQCQTVNCHKG